MIDADSSHVSQPIRVYLDNSDLSDMFAEKSPEHIAIRSELEALKESGRAVFVFSYLHISEFIRRPAPGYEKQHREKAKFLHLFCGSNALPHYIDVLEGKIDHKERGIWIPRQAFERIKLDLMASFSSVVDQKPGLNRSRRRQMKSRRVVKAAFSQASNLEAYITDIPITDKFLTEKSLTKFVRGEIDSSEFSLRLAELFCTPPVFYDSWYRDAAQGELLSNILEKMGFKLIEALEKTRVIMPKMQELRRKSIESRKAYYDTKRKLKDSLGFTPNLDESMFRNIPKFDVDQILESSGFSGRMAYFKHFIVQALKHGGYKKNDIGDLLHLFYTPDVDLMRIDKVMYSRMKNCPDLENSKFVSRLVDLPERIRILHASRSSVGSL